MKLRHGLALAGIGIVLLFVFIALNSKFNFIGAIGSALGSTLGITFIAILVVFGLPMYLLFTRWKRNKDNFVVKYNLSYEQIKVAMLNSKESEQCAFMSTLDQYYNKDLMAGSQCLVDENTELATLFVFFKRDKCAPETFNETLLVGFDVASVPNKLKTDRVLVSGVWSTLKLKYGVSDLKELNYAIRGGKMQSDWSSYKLLKALEKSDSLDSFASQLFTGGGSPIIINKEGGD